jgi:hypothetical protein
MAKKNNKSSPSGKSASTSKIEPAAGSEAAAKAEPNKRSADAPAQKSTPLPSSADKAAPEAVGEAKELRGPRIFGRFGIAVQVGVQILLAMIIFAQVNYIGCRRHDRWDLTQGGRFTLSTVSTNFLQTLDTEVRVVMAFMQQSDLHSEVEGMLSEYARQSNGRVVTEVLDLSRNRDRLTELGDLHGIEFNRNMLVVINDQRVKVIGAEDLVRRASDGRISEFRGEEILTSTLLEVAERQQKKIYMLAGNRVMDEMIVIGQKLVDLAAVQNLRVESFNLGTANAIPTDAEALFIAGPTVDLNTRELELIEDYWQNRSGSLFIMLNPNAPTPNLSSFIRKRGIAPQDDRILSVANIPGVASSGKIHDVPVNFIPVRPGLPGTEITRELIGIATTLTKQSQSLEVLIDDELLAADGIRVAPLAIADGRFWGETEYREEDVAANDNQDNTGVLYTAASAEQKPVNNPVATAADADNSNSGSGSDAESKTSRMVVVGNAHLLDVSGNTKKPNADFVMNSLNWLIDRTELIGITPRKPTAYSLSITPGQFGMLQTLAILILPGGALALGGLIWFLRRR